MFSITTTTMTWATAKNNKEFFTWLVLQAEKFVIEITKQNMQIYNRHAKQCKLLQEDEVKKLHEQQKNKNDLNGKGSFCTYKQLNA